MSPAVRHLLLASLLVAAGGAQAAGRFIEFLYIHPGEGNASGGHAAIKFEDEVFHFQHVNQNLLRLYRDDFAAFRFAYGYQENRGIEGRRISVEEQEFQALRDAFNRRFLIQNQQFAGLQSLDEDRALLLALKQVDPPTADSAKNNEIQLEALGYFVGHYRLDAGIPAPAVADPSHSPHLASLKQAIADQYGADFLRQKREAAKADLLVLQPQLTDKTTELEENRFQANELGYAQRYKSLLLDVAALDVLEAAIAPRPASLLTTGLAELQLGGPALAKLSGFRQSLRDDLLKLLQSERHDWGYALLVGMARLHAVEQSLRTGYLHVLDRRQTSAGNSKAHIVDSKNLAEVAGYLEKKLDMASRSLNSPEQMDEHHYSEIEFAATNWLNIINARNGNSSIAMPELGKTPALPAQAALVPSTMTGNQLDSSAKLVAAQFESYGDKLKSLYDYQLFSRNCVTEIFRIIHAGIQQQTTRQTGTGKLSPEAMEQISRQWLGGYIGDNHANIIPFVAFDEVGTQYRVDSSYRLATYRERRLDSLYQTKTGWIVDMTESNTLTSSIYRWHEGDAAFLFFTQDAVWPRPLLGGANLAAALGQTLYGLLALPWDSGENLSHSLTGIFVSIPELFFVNIRKGTFPQLLPGVTVVSE